MLMRSGNPMTLSRSSVVTAGMICALPERLRANDAI
jgi:hypothetical protein